MLNIMTENFQKIPQTKFSKTKMDENCLSPLCCFLQKKDQLLEYCHKKKY